MLVGVMMMWASGVIAARSLHALAPPIGLSLWRWFVGCVVLTPFALRAVIREWVPVPRTPGRLLLLGTLLAGGSTLLVRSLQFTTATNAGLVSAAQPIVTAVIAWAVIDERLSRRQLLGVLAVALGLLLMIARMDPVVILKLQFNAGDLLVSLAIVFYALYAVSLHRWVGHLSSVVMMYLTCVAGMCVVLPFYLIETLTVRPCVPHLQVLAATLYMALVPTVTATSMRNVAVGAVGVNRASSSINLLPNLQHRVRGGAVARATARLSLDRRRPGVWRD